MWRAGAIVLRAALVSAALGGCGSGSGAEAPVPGVRRIVSLSAAGSLACPGGAGFSFNDGDIYAGVRAALLDPGNFGPGGRVPVTFELRPSIDLIRQGALGRADILVVNRPRGAGLDAQALEAVRQFLADGGAVLSLGDVLQTFLGEPGECAADAQAIVRGPGQAGTAAGTSDGGGDGGSDAAENNGGGPHDDGGGGSGGGGAGGGSGAGSGPGVGGAGGGSSAMAGGNGDGAATAEAAVGSGAAAAAGGAEALAAILNGPFGAVGPSYATGYNCAFTGVSPDAAVLSDNSKGPNALVFVTGATPATGRAVAFADEEVFSGLAVPGCASAPWTANDANQRLALNVFAYLASATR